jgi:hypothetical protein
MAKKNDEKLESLKEEYEKIQQSMGALNISSHLAAHEEYLPELGDIEIYDYDIDTTETSEKAHEIVTSLVDLFLGDNEAIKKHPYIQNKLKEDAEVYAETLFLKKMTKKNLLTQMRQIDNGDNSSRMHEVVNNSFNQMRENIKFSTTQRTSLESFYKGIRSDLGLNEMSESPQADTDDDTEDKKSNVMDNRKMNEMMDKFIKGNKE